MSIEQTFCLKELSNASRSTIRMVAASTLHLFAPHTYYLRKLRNAIQCQIPDAMKSHVPCVPDTGCHRDKGNCGLSVLRSVDELHGGAADVKEDQQKLFMRSLVVESTCAAQASIKSAHAPLRHRAV